MDVYNKDRGHTKLHLYLFMLPLKKLIFFIVLVSIENWLVWRMRPSLRSKREDGYLHMLLVLRLIERSFVSA